MKRLRRAWRRLVGTFLGSRRDGELDRELESHLEMQIEANVRAGMSPEEARRSAVVAFGGIENVKESVRDQRGLPWLGRAWNDVCHGLRTLRKRPGFTMVAVLTLGLGIGSTTAIFSVVYGVLIRPLPYPNADKLVSLRHTAPGLALGYPADTLGSAASMYLTYRDQNRSFDHLGLWVDSEITLTGLGEPEQIRALAVTDGTFEALGVQPAIGRGFSESEHRPGAEGTEPVILSHAFWKRRFNGDASALGRMLLLNSRPSQVVGIMSANFRFLNLTPQPDVISPIRIDHSQMRTWDTVDRIALGNLNYNGLARLKEDVTLREASLDMARMLPIWLEAWPARPGLREAVANWRVAPALRPLKDEVIGGVAETLWLLMGSMCAVLLIACANVANLMLVRAEERRPEFAIRAALGAGQRRIAGVILHESLVLGAMGAVVGLTFAYTGLKLLRVLAPSNLPRLDDIAIDLPVLAFAGGAVFVSSLLCSIPAFGQALRRHALPGPGTREGTASRQRHRTRSALIGVQVALALLLLVGAGLMLRTFQALTSVDPGFTDPEHIQLARIFVSPAVIREPERYTRLYRDALERIAALPGVTAAGFGAGVPLEGRALLSSISVEDRPDAVGEVPPTRTFMSISPGYLEAFGTRLIAGRDLTWNDIDLAGNVVLVSKNLARELWGEPQAAIGKRIRVARNTTGPWLEIIGVTQDLHDTGLHQRPAAIVYLPIIRKGFDLRAVTYAIRSERAGSDSFIAELRPAVWASNSDVPVFHVRTMQDVYTASLSQTSFVLVLLTIASAMALALSVVGIYGVLSYIVSQRAREIGIRLALGARPIAVTRMFVLYGLGVAATGIAVGLGAAVAFSRWMTSLLFEVQPLDPATYLAVLGLLLAAVSLAAYLPAQRAVRVDPAETLRRE
jgi:predicted permease